MQRGAMSSQLNPHAAITADWATGAPRASALFGAGSFHPIISPSDEAGNEVMILLSGRAAIVKIFFLWLSFL